MPDFCAAVDARTLDEPSKDDIVDVTVALHPDGVDLVRAAEHGRNATAPHRIPFAGWKDIALRSRTSGAMTMSAWQRPRSPSTRSSP